MRHPPRDPKRSIFSTPVVVLLLVGGFWSTAIGLTVFLGSLSSGRPLEEAMAMTFLSLVLIELFEVYSFRSDRHSVLTSPFANKWLNIAIGSELGLLLVIVYLPMLQLPFGTFSLTVLDWALVLSLALTVIPVLELAKLCIRRGLLGPVD
jgi:Ca2+-transporting ATPase